METLATDKAENDTNQGEDTVADDELAGKEEKRISRGLELNDTRRLQKRDAIVLCAARTAGGTEERKSGGCA